MKIPLCWGFKSVSFALTKLVRIKGNKLLSNFCLIRNTFTAETERAPTFIRHFRNKIKVNFRFIITVVPKIWTEKQKNFMSKNIWSTPVRTLSVGIFGSIKNAEKLSHSKAYSCQDKRWKLRSRKVHSNRKSGMVSMAKIRNNITLQEEKYRMSLY